MARCTLSALHNRKNDLWSVQRDARAAKVIRQDGRALIRSLKTGESLGSSSYQQITQQNLLVPHQPPLLPPPPSEMGEEDKQSIPVTRDSAVRP
ncbi:hypothetical protein CDAR_114741 [Caerostris darwini]|uniref:Uncharacterized protein n=1 Tax=Caerostris darwini TaxID=1538125 RepID=A0AAV4ME39_9ARAC|nr:hypothetical protein CDAR_114741 [Caerostris darwini]